MNDCTDCCRYAVGTSGYSYNDWKGNFYPEDLSSGHYLDYYTRFFPVLELNYTFYRMPSASGIARYLTPAIQLPELSMKAFKGTTHGGPEVTINGFLARIQPLIDARRVKTILFQFPWSFRPGKDAWKKLHEISEHGQGFTAVVEFRHISWFSGSVLKDVERLNLSVCALDMPDIDGLPGTQFPSTHAIGYMRFHGRNRADWWNGDVAWKRYNYSYSTLEMKALVPQIQRWIDRHDRAYLYFNNHYQGQAVNNAQTLMAFLAE